jgi:hypothetical protein
MADPLTVAYKKDMTTKEVYRDQFG